MTHAKWLLGFGLLGLAACAADSFSLSSSGRDEAGNPTDEDRGSPSAGSDAPSFVQANGIVLAHAALFPSFRLCFENRPDLVPQPDATIMPGANVVGVEIGSLVRIDPVTAPGKIYVINERDVRSAPGDPGATCGELITPNGPRSLTLNNDYHVIDGALTKDLGRDGVDILVISGCGSQGFLDAVGAGTESTSCGVGWNTTSGNLGARVLRVEPRARGAEGTLPVQLFDLAPAVTAVSKPVVTFGDLTGKPPPARLEQEVIAGELFTGGTAQELVLDQTDPAVFGTRGFRVQLGSGASTKTFDLSLANVQELSAPNTVPTTYYAAASNYALLLLGDPKYGPDQFDGGASNPAYNPRRAVHLLAVPVVDPATADDGDAGDASTTGDAGSVRPTP